MIPNFQEIMYPLLNSISDWNIYSSKDVVEKLKIQFWLSQQECEQMLPSWTQPVFHNRVQWSKSYLKMSWLLEYPNRWSIKITEQGIKILSNTTSLNLSYLKTNTILWDKNLNENWKNLDSEYDNNVLQTNLTPDELIDESYKKARNEIIIQLLDKIRALDRWLVEKLCVNILLALWYWWYTRWDVTQRSRDDGIDGIIFEDKLWLHKIYVQVKRYKDWSKIWNWDVLSFIWAISNQWGAKWIFITTSDFSEPAIQVAKNNTNIVLIDWVQLSNLMFDNNIWVSIEKTYDLKRLDSDFFDL